MALGSLVHRIKVQISDTDRGVYETVDLRLAQHPSETPSYLVTRLLAYCLCYEDGIAFGHGLSHVDEPAVWVKTLDGRLLAWIEVGTPSAERLHKASKGCARVVVFTHHDPRLLQREAQRLPIHRVEHIEVFAPDPALVEALSEALGRNVQWELTRSGGHLYVNVGSRMLDGPLTPHALA
ncbi:MAG: YaeQ family protein [Polyangiales bacterium]